MVSWAYFWVCGIVLQLLGCSREYDGPETPEMTVDIIQGEIPSVQIAGGGRKVLLGVPLSVRLTWSWRIVWWGGAFVSLGSLIPLYQIIGRYPARLFYVWIGYQVIWLVLRCVFFHYADEIFEINHALYPVSQQQAQDPEIKVRILGLIAATADQQIPMHPRGTHGYKLDCTDTRAIMSYCRKADWKLSMNALDCTDLKVKDIVYLEVMAIMGDTMTSSTSWMLGMKMTSLDLYDSSLVVVEIAGRTHIIPVTRALSSPPKGEESEVVFNRQGTTNDGTTSNWVIWVPAGPDRWIFLAPGLQFVGKLMGTVQDDAEVCRVLLAGSLHISLRDVSEIKETVNKTRLVGDALCKMLAPAKDIEKPIQISEKADLPPFDKELATPDIVETRISQIV
jgi:hypothetical protein